jgi:ABC-2 type transport system ATP-binding protein
MIGLDPAGQRELRDIVLELSRAGVVIIVSTHLLQNVESFCDRLLILKGGRSVAVGRVSDLLAAHGGRSLEDTFLDIVR